MSRLRWATLALVIAAAAAMAALPVLRVYWRWRESNPVRRGAAIAARVGCVSCHGPNGSQGLPDPALGEEVPAWDGGVAMMYVNGPDEVREFVLDGTTRRRATSDSARAQRDKAAIRMPPFRAVLSPREVEDVVAYFVAASRTAPVPAGLTAGRDLVARYRCEACHGVGGSGGVANPGSFKGYVPGWLGRDFGELVRDADEARGWILDGAIPRLEQDPLARYFLHRQRLRMPAYRAALSPAEADAIFAYIRHLRAQVP